MTHPVYDNLPDLEPITVSAARRWMAAAVDIAIYPREVYRHSAAVSMLTAACRSRANVGRDGLLFTFDDNSWLSVNSDGMRLA